MTIWPLTVRASVIGWSVMAGGCYGAARLVDGECPEGEALCGDACVDTSRDPENCGSCAVVCGTGEVCVSGRCDGRCESECSAEGERRCDPVAVTGVQTCGDSDGDGCLEWGARVACPEGRVCIDGLCTFGCSDPCPYEGERRCVGATGTVTCIRVEGSPCLRWSEVEPCPDGLVCLDDGACVRDDLSAGLVLWYSDFTLDGTSFRDSSPSGNDGIASGPVPTTDRFGIVDGALLFDGVDDHADSSDLVPIAGNSPRSIVAWTRLNSVEGLYVVAGWGHVGWSGGLSELMVFFGEGSTLAAVLFHGHWVDLTVEEVLEVGTWHQIAAVYDGATMTLYVDGAQVGYGDMSLYTASTGFHVGLRPQPPPYEGWNTPFNGAIGEIRVYSRALSASDIEALYLE